MHNRNAFFAVAALGSVSMISSFAGCSSSGNNNATKLGEGYVGDFDQIGLTAGAMPSVVKSTDVWQDNATSGSKVLYNDNYLGAPGVFGTADIESIDLSTTAGPTTVVSEADANYYVTADKKTLVYSFGACSQQATPGIYAMPVL